MTDADRLIRAACKKPKDETVRGAAADACREAGESELGDVVEGDTGPDLLTRTAKLSKDTGLPVSLKLLWTAYAVLPRMQTQPTPAPFVPQEQFIPPLTYPPVPRPRLPRGGEPWTLPPGPRWDVRCYGAGKAGPETH